jgi:hypothetical protein
MTWEQFQYVWPVFALLIYTFVASGLHVLGCYYKYEIMIHDHVRNVRATHNNFILSQTQPLPIEPEDNPQDTPSHNQTTQNIARTPSIPATKAA